MVIVPVDSCLCLQVLVKLLLNIGDDWRPTVAAIPTSDREVTGLNPTQMLVKVVRHVWMCKNSKYQLLQNGTADCNEERCNTEFYDEHQMNGLLEL